MTTPQQRGREAEVAGAELVGGQPVPGSGNGVRKLDVAGNSLLFSWKLTEKKSLRVDQAMLDELRTATTGLGGIGSDTTPVLVCEIEGIGRKVALLDLDDLIALLKMNPSGLISATKDEQRRAAVSQPGLLRDE